jgi:hypothetical protein
MSGHECPQFHGRDNPQDGLDPAVSSDRRNTSAMMSALHAEVMGWGIESIMGIG